MRRVVVTLVAALCLAAMPAAASTFVHLSQQEMVAQADAVIQGKVVEVASFWSESGRIIVSEAMVEVEEVLLGQAPATVTVRTFGGQVGDIRVEAHGFPRFAKNERVILFLQAEPEDGSIRVLGYQEGHFRIVTRRDRVTLAVPMVDENARYLTSDGRLAPEPKSVEIRQFKERIRNQAALLSRGPR